MERTERYRVGRIRQGKDRAYIPLVRIRAVAGESWGSGSAIPLGLLVVRPRESVFYPIEKGITFDFLQERVPGLRETLDATRAVLTDHS